MCVPKKPQLKATSMSNGSQRTMNSRGSPLRFSSRSRSVTAPYSGGRSSFAYAVTGRSRFSRPSACRFRRTGWRKNFEREAMRKSVCAVAAPAQAKVVPSGVTTATAQLSSCASAT